MTTFSEQLLIEDFEMTVAVSANKKNCLYSMPIYMLFKYDFYVKGTSSKFKLLLSVNNCANFDSKNDIMYFFQYLKKPSLSRRL